MAQHAVQQLLQAVQASNNPSVSPEVRKSAIQVRILAALRYTSPSTCLNEALVAWARPWPVSTTNQLVQAAA